jgi:hypothetical protein
LSCISPLSRIVALEPEGGSLIWSYDPKVRTPREHRGVSYWPGVPGGSTKGALTCGFLAGMSVPLPPIDEQQEIASIVEGKVQEFQVSLISLLEVLHELRAEKSRIDKAIAQIESKTGRQQRSKRGRKGMGTEERKVVSTRMKHYWEQRRRAQA